MYMFVCVYKLSTTDSPTVRRLPSSFCYVTSENVVGMVFGRERLRDKGRERGTGKRRERVKVKRKERGWETETEVREPADVKMPAITSCFSSTPSLSLSLSTLSSFQSHLNSSPSASLQCDVGVLICDNNSDASVRAHANTGLTYSGRVEESRRDILQGHVHTHTWVWCHTAVAFEPVLWMTAFCRNPAEDSSHRQDRSTEKKSSSLPVFTSPPTPSSSPTTRTLSEACDQPWVSPIGYYVDQNLDWWIHSLWCQTKWNHLLWCTFDMDMWRFITSRRVTGRNCRKPAAGVHG